LEKQQLNLFSSPKLPRLLEELNADEYVVYGVVTEYCVRFAALGLLDTGRPVSLVTDAIQSLKPEEAEHTFREFAAKGGKVTTVNEVCSR
jgi:nicotinamidase/pyrazinamidase